MAIDANFEDDDAVANCDDVEVGSKKLCLENAVAQVRHGESSHEDFEGEGGRSVIEESEGDEEDSGTDESDEPFFTLGMTFANHEEIKMAISQYAIMYGVKLRILKSEPSRIKAKCQEGCPFVLYASKEGENPGLKVKTLCYEHRCFRIFKNPRATAKWLAGYFKNKIQERPHYRISDMKKDIEADFNLHVSVHKCKRAKKLIREEVEGSHKDDFGNLAAYCNKLTTKEASGRKKIDIAQQIAPLDQVAMRQPITEKLTKSGSTSRCSICRQVGHNKSTCKEHPPSTSTNTAGQKRGRPKEISCNASQDAQQSQITQEVQSQPITSRPKLPIKSSYKKGADLETGSAAFNPGMPCETVIQEGAA